VTALNKAVVVIIKMNLGLAFGIDLMGEVTIGVITALMRGVVGQSKSIESDPIDSMFFSILWLISTCCKNYT
jgi:hypothetical protein